MQDQPTLAGRPRRHRLASALLGATALVGLGAFGVHAADTTAIPPASQNAAPIDTANAARPMPDFADLVARVRPAVVQVTNTLKISPAADESDDGDNMPMMPGLPRNHPPVPNQGHGDNHAGAREARGSGFLIDADGTIVTNNHVVKDAQSVSVTLDDGTVLPAKVIGRDSRTDLAVLRVDAGHKLPFLQLGNSGAVRPGEWVIAMGNPFGLGGTVTAGIVSASGRDIGSGPYDNYIQIDAPINHGNSGGPLFSQNGQVIGVNSAILSPSGGSIGIGFAIPSDMVRTVVSQLEQSGHVTRGYLGVESQPVAPALAEALKLPHDSSGHPGALVAGVQDNSPAQKAGIQAGDVIVGVDGQKVGTPRELAVDIAAVKPGTSTKVEVVREGQPRTVSVDIVRLTNQIASADESRPAHQGGIGLSLAPVPTPQDGSAASRGALVQAVRPNSAAAAAGLREGDVIVGVGARAVGSPDEAVNAIRSAENGATAIALRVQRDGHAAFVAVTLPKSDAGKSDADKPAGGDQQNDDDAG